MAGRRLELGFEGGAVLRVTLDDAAVDALTASLGNDKGWTALKSDDETVMVNLGDLVYVRVPPAGPNRVGFAGE
jgi:hypothetical protein